MDEFSLIDRLFKRPVRNPEVALAIGDDCALLDVPDRRLALTTDTLIAGVHFRDAARAYDIGFKALAVNLSDLAAMGAQPLAFLLSLSLPAAEESWLLPFRDGLFDLADAHGLDCIGGDTVRGPLGVTITAIGKLPPGGGLRRNGARVGDPVYVTGDLGEAALGFYHRRGDIQVPEKYVDAVLERLDRPRPRCFEGVALRDVASAAIDLSDGLAGDLNHITSASRVGAEIDLRQLPVSEAYEACRATVGWEAAIAFGDDYELCFTVPVERLAAFEDVSARFDCRVRRIGQITAEPGIRWFAADGPYVPRGGGFRHFD